jgi:hypothetical protein
MIWQRTLAAPGEKANREARELQAAGFGKSMDHHIRLL